MTARQVLNNAELGSSFRSKLNSNFTELFDPDYFVAARTVAQSIPNATWTTVIFDSPYANKTGMTMNTSTGEMTFPIGGSDDCSGAWMISGIVAWDNTLASLQLHTRKIRIRTYENATTYKEWATSDGLFDPALGVTSPLDKSHLQVYAQPLIDSALTSCKMYIQVWHNAKVGGSPVSIDIEPVGIEAPLVIGSRLSNYS